MSNKSWYEIDFFFTRLKKKLLHGFSFFLLKKKSIVIGIFFFFNRFLHKKISDSAARCPILAILNGEIRI